MDAKPLVRRIDETARARRRGVRNVSGDTQREFPVVSITSARLTPFAVRRSGSTSTWSCRSRRPQTATLATPGTLMRRGRIVQRARTDWSMSDTLSDDSDTIMRRLVDDSG
jgi:hypothetical protein